MASMVDAARTAVMAVVAHCLSMGGKVAAVLSRALAFAMRRAGARCLRPHALSPAAAPGF